MTKAKAEAPVQFGSDEWGKWASGVQDTLTKISERLAALEKRMDTYATAGIQITKAGDDKTRVIDETAFDARIARLEQMQGIR